MAAACTTLTNSTRLFKEVSSNLEQDGWMNVLPSWHNLVKHPCFTYKFLMPNKSFLHQLAVFGKKNDQSDHSSFQSLLIFNKWANDSRKYIHNGAIFTFVDEFGSTIMWDFVKQACAYVTKKSQVEYISSLFIDTLYQITCDNIATHNVNNKREVSLDFIVKDFANDCIVLKINSIFRVHPKKIRAGLLKNAPNMSVKPKTEAMNKSINLFDNYMSNYRENSKKYLILSDLLNVIGTTFVFGLCLRDTRLDKIDKTDETAIQHLLKSIDYKDAAMNVISRFGIVEDKPDKTTYGLFILDDYSLGSPHAAHGGLIFSMIDTIGAVTAIMSGFAIGQELMTKRAMIKYIRPVRIYTLYRMVTKYDIKTVNQLIVSVNVVDDNNNNTVAIGQFVYVRKENAKKKSPESKL